MWIAFVDLIFSLFFLISFLCFLIVCIPNCDTEGVESGLDQSWEHVIYSFLHCLQKMEHGLKQWT